jgi:hypothetical protein
MRFLPGRVTSSRWTVHAEKRKGNIHKSDQVYPLSYVCVNVRARLGCALDWCQMYCRSSRAKRRYSQSIELLTAERVVLAPCAWQSRGHCPQYGNAFRMKRSASFRETRNLQLNHFSFCRIQKGCDIGCRLLRHFRVLDSVCYNVYTVRSRALGIRLSFVRTDLNLDKPSSSSISFHDTLPFSMVFCTCTGTRDHHKDTSGCQNSVPCFPPRKRPKRPVFLPAIILIVHLRVRVVQ